MKTILRILERAGGYRPPLYLKIENRLIWPLSSRPHRSRGRLD
jgi:hypothetical protein